MADAQHRRSRDALVPGLLVADRWELQEPLAQGRRSEVWRCLDRRLERTVAIKVIRSDFVDDPDALRSFERQLGLLGGVEDPHVMRIFDAVKDHGRLLLICELIEGRDLAAVLEHRVALGLREVAALGIQLAQGLGTMHRRSLVHRDVRPENVVVMSTGVIKLVGVGDVKWALTDSTVTDRASLLAEAAYLAPEQLFDAGVDPRIDIYAAGVVLWQALTGERPPELWLDEDPLAAEHLLKRPSSLRPEVPELLDEVVWRATSVDPAARFSDGNEMADALAGVAPDRPTEVTRALYG